MSYKIIRKGDKGPYRSHRMAALPPSPEERRANVARAQRRWDRYRNRMERLNLDGKAPRHIQEKARMV